MTIEPTPEPNDDDVTDAEIVDVVDKIAGALGAELVPADDGTLVPSGGIVGTNEWTGVDTGDVDPDVGGFLTMIPMNSKLDGGFTDLDTGETGVRELDFVWLAKKKTRAAFIKVADDGTVERREYNAKDPTGPDCRSFNGITADPASPLLQNAGDCTTCPLARWTDGQIICKDAIEAMAFIPDEAGGRLASLRFKGISLATARAYWKSFDERLPVIPPIAYVTHVRLEPEDTDNGKFLQARFERGVMLTRQEAQPLIDERTRRLADWQKSIEADVATATVAADEGASARKSEPFPDTNAEAQTYDGESGEEF